MTAEHLALLFVIAVNIRSYYMMWQDKGFAQRSERRTPETTLLLNALILGAFGVVAASFPPVSHKGRKVRFMTVAYVCLAMNVLVLWWWFR